VYGDYGFSPDVLFLNIPFPINIQNESFELKAELFDINSNQIIKDLRTTITFDVLGESLTAPRSINDLTKVIGISGNTNNYTVYNAGNFNIEQNLYAPNIDPCDDSPHRFLGWHVPQGSSVDNGKICYTKVSKLFIDDDYISLSTVEGNVETTVRSLAIVYDGANNKGRRIYVSPSGVKTKWP
jgi:hypothetical protein